MPVTPTFNFPYPALSDSPHGPNQIGALAQAVEDELEDTIASLSLRDVVIATSVANRDAIITAPVNGQFAITTDTYKTWYYRAGVWTVFPNPPLFQGRQTTAQNIPDSTFTDITFNAEDHDTHGGHDNVTNNARYTAQYSGVYELGGGCPMAANATGFRALHWSKNGAQLAGGDSTQISVGAGSVTRVVARTLQVTLAVGDYVTLQAFQNSTVTIATFVTTPVQPSVSIKYLGG